MTKKNSKRSVIRKEQSERDKLKYLSDYSHYGQVAAFQQLLGTMQRQGMHGDYIVIPLELIDLTAAFIASLISVPDFLMPDKYAFESFRASGNFIRKTLARAQISCSSLVVCLWYIDQFFHHGRRKQRSLWHPRDLFIASIVVADKYLADITWTNADWAEWTNYTYSCEKISSLERRFMNEMNYSLFVAEEDYSHFCHYLEFRLNLRQIIGNQSSVLSMSYHNIDVLSRSLPPIYVKRLCLSLRPLEAIFLLTKTATSMCVAYAAAVMAVASISYVVCQHATWMHHQLLMIMSERQVQEHAVVMMVEMIKSIDHRVDHFSILSIG